MSGKNQVLCLGCNAPLEVDLSDESNVVHCDNCGTLSVVQPGMTEISSAEPEDALPFSLDDLLAEGDEAELSPPSDADQDDSFELDDDLFSHPRSTQQPSPVTPELKDNPAESTPVKDEHTGDNLSGVHEPTTADPAMGQPASLPPEPVAEKTTQSLPSAPTDVVQEKPVTGTADSAADAVPPSLAVPAVPNLPTSVVVPDIKPPGINPPGIQNVAAQTDGKDDQQDDQHQQIDPASSLTDAAVTAAVEIQHPTTESEPELTVEQSAPMPALQESESGPLSNAEQQSADSTETNPAPTQAEISSGEDPTTAEAEDAIPEVEGDYPTSGSDSMITGDLMFFFESLEDAPDDAQPAASETASVGDQVKPNLAEPATAAAVATATAQISTSSSDTEADQASIKQADTVSPAAAASTPRAVRNLLNELFASLKDETSIISHVNEDEEDFRTALKAYLEALPNHNLTRMAPKASISRIVDVQTGKLTLSLYQEKRSLVKRTVAYKGWAIPERKRDETNTRAWDISWKPPKEPTDSEESKIVSDSQELKGCNRCQQTGQAACKKCRGKGRFGCAACTASGLMVCNSCEGSGQRSGSRQVRGTRRCTICAGAGKQQYIPADDPESGPKVRTCTKCAGSGRESFVEAEAFQVACESCNASGRIPCQVCHGKRNVACQDCSGRGARQCRACLGNKILVTYLEVRRTFQERTVSSDLIGAHAEELFAKSFQTPFSVGHHQSHYWSGPAPLQVAEMIAQATGHYEGLAETAREFLDHSLQNSLSDEKIASRTTAWKVDLQQFSTRSVIYTIGKRKYRTLWDTKESDTTSSTAALPQVFPHRSIVTNWCLSQLSELRRNAEETGVRDAALRYQRLQAIADVDPACKQAIAEQESTKDDTLQQIVTASRTVKASRAQLIMYCTAAIILIAAIPIYFWLNDLIPVIGCVVAAAVVGLIGWKVVGND